MALGAKFGDIASLIFKSTLASSAVGLAVGVMTSRWLMGLLQSLLVRINAGDPRTSTLAGVALLGVAILAAAGPAFRAARSDPAEALRRG
jgi:ABC-type antimicrobial peptide transport system permease subunit